MWRLALLLLLAGGARGEDDATEALLKELDTEVAARREGGRGADADALAAEVDALRRRLAENGAPGESTVPEAHVVYVRDAPEGRIDVRVTARSRPVVLVLGSREAATWHVDAKGANLQRIITFWGRDRLVIAEPRVPVETLRTRAFRDDGPPYLSLARQVESASGRAVTTFLGAEKPEPGKPFLVGPENPEWNAQEVRADVARLHWSATRVRRAALREELKKERFEFLYRWREGGTLHAAFGDWTPLGPLLARQRGIPDLFSAADVAVRDEERDEIYLLRARALIRCPLEDPNNKSEVLRVPDTLPQVHESTALAIDTRRKRLLLATRHDHGYLYALDLAKREWSVLNDLDDVDACGMFYDERRDTVLCVERQKDGTLRLERFSPVDGRHLRGTTLRIPPLPEERPVAGACRGNRLILLYPPPESQAYRVGEDSLVFVADLVTGDVIHRDCVRCWEDFTSLPEPRLAELWETLTDVDDAKAGCAMRWLAGQGDAAVAFLAERFRPEPGAIEDLDRWVRMLSDDDTLRRDLAQFHLAHAGAEAEEYLAGLDLDALTPEARRRVAAALQQVEEPGRNRRALRAITALEWIDTPAAEALLRELAARGDPRRKAAAEQALLRMSAPRRDAVLPAPGVR